MEWGSNNFGAPGQTGNRMAFQGGFGTSNYRPKRQYVQQRNPAQPQSAPAPQYSRQSPPPQQQTYARPQQQPNMNYWQNAPQYGGPQMDMRAVQQAYQARQQQAPPPMPSAGNLYNQGRAPMGNMQGPPQGEQLIANPYLRPGEMGPEVVRTRAEWDKWNQDRQPQLLNSPGRGPEVLHSLEGPTSYNAGDRPFGNRIMQDPYSDPYSVPSHRIAPFEEQRRRY